MVLVYMISPLNENVIEIPTKQADFIIFAYSKSIFSLAYSKSGSLHTFSVKQR